MGDSTFSYLLLLLPTVRIMVCLALFLSVAGRKGREGHSNIQGRASLGEYPRDVDGVT